MPHEGYKADIPLITVTIIPSYTETAKAAEGANLGAFASEARLPPMVRRCAHHWKGTPQEIVTHESQLEEVTAHYTIQALSNGRRISETGRFQLGTRESAQVRTLQTLQEGP
jgi:hypothetical protein